jgi:hypothetical protein
MRKPPLFFVAVLFLLVFFPRSLWSQSTPDTIVANYNQSLPGSSWQYSFVQITDIHIGEGAPGDDYGTAGYDDNISPGDAGDPLLRLRNSVLWINQHLSDLNIHFVIVTGDLSESAELSELLRCKQVLDSLEVPYIPMMGNHDIWPLSQGVESPIPNGDSLYNIVFADAFATAQAYFPGWDDGTRLTKTWDSENSCYAYYQNFLFSYGSYTYLITDFVSRAHDIAVFNGAAADAQLHDLPGGTWPWLQQTITNYPVKGMDNMLIFAHHPLSKSILSGTFASFDYTEYDIVTQYLLTQKDWVGAWIAGHKHNVDEYNIKTWTFSTTMATGYEAAANWEFANGHFRIFKVFDTIAPQPASIASIQSPDWRVFPNPCTEVLNVQWAADLGVNAIELFNAQGLLVARQTLTANQRETSFDMRAFSSGLYLAVLRGKVVTSTLIVH